MRRLIMEDEAAQRNSVSWNLMDLLHQIARHPPPPPARWLMWGASVIMTGYSSPPDLGMDFPKTTTRLLP